MRTSFRSTLIASSRCINDEKTVLYSMNKLTPIFKDQLFFNDTCQALILEYLLVRVVGERLSCTPNLQFYLNVRDYTK